MPVDRRNVQRRYGWPLAHLLGMLLGHCPLPPATPESSRGVVEVLRHRLTERAEFVWVGDHDLRTTSIRGWGGAVGDEVPARVPPPHGMVPGGCLVVALHGAADVVCQPRMRLFRG